MKKLAYLNNLLKLLWNVTKKKYATLKSLNNGDRWEEIFDLYTQINTQTE
jgi:hypothetical protein